MGKIIRNGITYGIDENNIKNSIQECSNAGDNGIAGASSIVDLKNTILSNYQSKLTSLSNTIYNKDTSTSFSKKNASEINTGIAKLATTYYNSGVSATKKGNATAACVRSGYTFTNSSSVNASGTMANYTGSTVRKAFTPGTSSGSYTIPSGFHDGSGTVTCAAVSATKTLGATNGTKVDMSGAYRYVNTKAVYDAGYSAGSTAGTNASNAIRGHKIRATCGRSGDDFDLYIYFDGAQVGHHWWRDWYSSIHQPPYGGSTNEAVIPLWTKTATS